jgi:pilus assembly protein CpaB
MNALRIAILVAAAIAAIAVAFFVRQAMNAPAPDPVQVEERPAARVLAARRDLAVGERVTASDLYWQAWPDEAVSPGYVVEGRGQTTGDFNEAVVRSPLTQGEPVTSSKLVQPGDAGFMAAILTPGMRAVAVPISAETGAGGFILPNDRVDVIVSFQVEREGGGRSSRVYMAQTVAENVRVLAIDQFYGEEEEVVVGETATLELSPAQARDMALAVARGEISLSLRSLTGGDVRPSLVAADYGEPTENVEPRAGTVTLYRYGQARRVGVQDQ